MKTKITYVLASIIFSFALSSCGNPINDTASETIAMYNEPIEKKNNNAVAVMTFSETEFDFGTVAEGDILKHTFSFTNTGNAPLVIVNAKGSCGCTVSNWPKEPIAPGATEEMLVTFNTNGKPNLQNKQVTITTNAATGKQILKIKAMVTPKIKNTVSGIPLSK
ncbi:DUF1573 domain-containing protein [uncultured Aquimarina sp.]|uniref:DUF1573 domain-containing protein n=1 Tax=uncultured Aquimarina sp. TaxID=575652 RepID=UPI00260E646D|nr:DUF1573 domain-containing protein [uncultured Aquimarina sp.]